MRPNAPRWALLAAFLAFASPPAALAERGGPPELAPGESVSRRPPASLKAERVARSRALAAAQRAEMDSLAALAADSPADAGRAQRAIEAAKRRHAREELALHREFALRAGDTGLARRIETRMAALAGGAR